MTTIYTWQKQLTENAALVFQKPRQSTKQEDAKDRKIVAWLGGGDSKYFDWKKRYGKVNEYNGATPRDHWLNESEQNAILAFHAKNPLEGYRRLNFMMLDANVVAASPSMPYSEAYDGC